MLNFDIWLIICVVVLAVFLYFLNENFNNVPKLKPLISNLIIWGSVAIVVLSVMEPILHKHFMVG